MNAYSLPFLLHKLYKILTELVHLLQFFNRYCGVIIYRLCELFKHYFEEYKIHGKTRLGNAVGH